VIVLDTFGTYYVTAAGAGPQHPDGPFVMRGETPDGTGTRKFDVVLRWVDADTYVTEIVFHLADRDPFVAVSATHRRATS
jgi:hypothetical protein